MKLTAEQVKIVDTIIQESLQEFLNNIEPSTIHDESESHSDYADLQGDLFGEDGPSDEEQDEFEDVFNARVSLFLAKLESPTSV